MKSAIYRCCYRQNYCVSCFRFAKSDKGMFVFENEYSKITGRAFHSIDEAKKEFEQIHSNLVKLINVGE